MGEVSTVDQARYEAIRSQLDDALAEAEAASVRHSIRNALQLLVREQEAADGDARD